MSIAELREKCKGLLARIPRDALMITVLVLMSSASFALGYLAGRDEGQGRAVGSEDSPSVIAESAASATGTITASKNGTKYYLPGCAGANRIREDNKVRFATAAAAISAGYTLAENCK